MRDTAGTPMTAEAALAGIAARQHGMVTWAQLRESGVSRRSVARHVTDGWLVRRHTGVYQLGVFAGAFGDEMAALLVCGPRAALSHWASIAVFELRPRGGRPVDVSLIGGLAGQRDGIRPHRALALPTCDVVRRHGLRVTTPARALLDVAASTPRAELERLTEEAQLQNVLSTAELLAVVERLVVEVDGYGYHGTRATFERDRRKDADLMLAGYRVFRITWRRLVREREAVIALLATALRP
jgi:hypothetical protein